jgi:hypothetical protein
MDAAHRGTTSKQHWLTSFHIWCLVARDFRLQCKKLKSLDNEQLLVVYSVHFIVSLFKVFHVSFSVWGCSNASKTMPSESSLLDMCMDINALWPEQAGWSCPF